MQITSTQLKIKTKRDDSYELSLFFCFMEGEYENPTHILTLHIIEKLMSALCNLDYQVNHQNLMTALDDLIKVGIGGRRRKRKLKYASEEARFDFQGDVLNITHNGMTKGVEAKGKGIGS